ncbi:hypothetical protein QE369_002027 [Agrobacterium larrymoorei]|uniref:Uncharacterized protein n=1 Tax=Agrobacterium larrymoorei TaxID=160699 RepID=A0AAJ2ER54_9HYPH|nr:hypothetical protein [Agrobacterium larrymoorei]
MTVTLVSNVCHAIPITTIQTPTVVPDWVRGRTCARSKEIGICSMEEEAVTTPVAGGSASEIVAEKPNDDASHAAIARTRRFEQRV